MNCKAFTLVEVLATIIVLGIIMAIIIPNVFVSIDDTKLKTYTVKENEIIKASRNYVLENKITLPQILNERIKIGLLDLTSNNYLSKIYDLTDNSLCVGYVYVTKTHTENYTYTPCIFCGTYETDNVLCDINEV